MTPWTFRFLVLVLGLLAAGAPSANAQADPVTTGFQAANARVAEGDITEGIALYRQLPLTNHSSAALEYNRGVAHARLGEAGQARAHWLVAERLAPRSPAIQTALARPAGQPDTNPFSSPVSWTDRLTLNEWGILALVFTWTWGLLLILGRLRPGWVSALQGYTLGAGVLSVVIVGLLVSAWVRRARLPNAVVLRPETSVRVSPLEEARPAFVLAEGTRVKATEDYSGWYRVEDPLTRRFGWVQGDDILSLPLR